MQLRNLKEILSELYMQISLMTVCLAIECRQSLAFIMRS